MSDDRYAAELAYAHDLTLPQGRRLAELAVHALDPTFAPESPLHLADPAIAEAFIAAPLGRHADDASVERAEGVARRAVEAGHETAGAWFVRACVAEHRGQVEAQRHHLARSLAIDGGFGPSLLGAGFLSFVEGDLRRARRSLEAVGDDRRTGWMLHTLSHQRAPAAGAERNLPCPCGSGAKRKRCCGAQPPLPERAWWLWDKAKAWTERLAQEEVLVERCLDLADIDHDDWNDPDEGLVQAFEEVPVQAIALLEGGMLRRFLDRCGGLLPPDERQLAEHWAGERHQVWRVLDVTPGTSLVLEALDGGRTVEALNGRVSRCTSPGEVVYAPVLWSGDAWHLPCHPAGLDPDDGELLVALASAGIDPWEIASTLVRGIRSATM
jgi:hypothetical protein